MAGRKNHHQLGFVYWGGARKGAGRPKRGFRSSERHTARPKVKPTFPMHVTLRIESDIDLRRRDIYDSIRRALATVLGRDDFRIVDVSLQRSHIHLIVEADNNLSLSRGMQAFQIAAASHINKAITARGIPRKGRVFSDRYHVRILRTPLEVRRARLYVLNNWLHHSERDRGDMRAWWVDPYSSAASFDGWKEWEGDRLSSLPAGYEALPVSKPRTWLMRKGWLQHGKLSIDESPRGHCGHARETEIRHRQIHNRPTGENAPDVAVDCDDRPRAFGAASETHGTAERARSHTRQL